jgi:hypothetical protein
MGYDGKVWELKELRYSAHATTANGSIEVKTDRPSGGMLVRSTVAVATSAVRVTDQQGLDGIEAKQLQVKFIPGATGIFRVYKATVLARPIGVYLEGSKGDFYETQPIPLGA